MQAASRLAGLITPDRLGAIRVGPPFHFQRIPPVSLNSHFLDLDYLKSTGATPAYFGLGFIQLKIDEHRRIHFWIDKGIVGSEETHDHRYPFYSEVLKGYIENYDFTFIPNVNGEFEMVSVSCDPENPAPQHGRKAGHMEQTGYQALSAGSGYNIQAGRFHQSYADPGTVTLLTRGETRFKYANVIRGRNDKAICAFSKTLSVEECWEKIAEILNPAPKGKPGYHLAEIPKGEVGEVSKIVEEALELQDFDQQRTAVGGLVELSDLVGAIEAYLAKHHPSIGLSDLKTFADITKRVFENGHR
jgi:hypothetical protein